MVYITGDTHGEYSRFKSRESRKIKKGDVLIVLGDFGFFWNGGKSEKKLLKKLSKLKYTLLFIDGTHENHLMLDALPEGEKYGGAVHRAADNVFHLKRGEIYEIEGEAYFTFGGGAAPEFVHEGSENRERSLPSAEEIEFAKKKLSERGNTVDYILTHEPSQKTGGYLNAIPRASGTGVFLTFVENTVSYSRWYFGSLHIDKQISKGHRSVFEDIIPVREAVKRKKH